ncbi:alpha-1,3-mannosyl-glycoprotein 4-beta-N-acetylglucosaminyltransferase C-like [Megalops cyprinoides]|uniref:alpha-1,3-mannosyl-glycoprotein 4-beta-N-acetylglucosaminyltransferase C-like n=1 Tax=Megalops cyprinoides TaxID=118141 RepID=UPI001864D0B7|nr:alpha-1,3-mannosyl-glycoprotein 4-beta-N-acetylglucosaminyltransferase C-like [Megalops cyprinoides]XP_036389389.1 alpha-1,3-mannosyl-glycoprotein 4-beta-N-acetylglucosaminyltransferase C-like [Megalops cyprinoides]XP_036389391.1 alpha-1,3-mannosyl-glycoprotein 4-beta-N-acetylglucosaminyltransferase C-like [Megalops cyprinoides]
MRIYWKKTSTAAVLFLACAIFFITISHDGTKTSDLHLSAREIIWQQMNSERSVQILRGLQNDSVPFNVSYSVLAGLQMQTRKYLTVGLSSIKRKRGSYLLDTLQSIFSQSSEEELKQMVVVVLLADFDMEWKRQMVSDILGRFPLPILRGQLLVIHAPQEHYPPLEGLKRNFNDKPDRVYFRSKQNIDYAFLFSFCANLSDYYIMLEDDVACAKNFLTAMKRFIQGRGQSYWVTLEFSKLGYIGKLYHSSDLPRLAYFLFLFYQEMPCDWLLTHFNALLAQKDVIRCKPSLFQHMGLYSSFQGTVNRLKDEDFEEDPTDMADSPPADVFTDIAPFEKYTPSKAYGATEGYFWGKSPSAGSHFTIVLHKPAIFRRVSIRTGSQDRRKDMLESAEVEVGHKLEQTTQEPKCSEYFKLGPLIEGQFDRNNIQEGISSTLSCLRIKVTKSQQAWVIIETIKIWTLNENESLPQGPQVNT